MTRWLTKALLILASLVFALALCEAGLWFLGIEYPNFYDYDPIVGSKLRPGIKGYWLEEGGGYVSINSDGLRDREHSIEKAPNALRIAVLGDSYAEAMQVNQEEAFWAVMERKLQECVNLGNQQVEVINFGQSCLGTTQELLILRHRVWKYSPDVVLLAFVTGNDIADNSPALMLWPHFPYYRYQNGELVLHDQHTKERWLTFEAAEKRRKKLWSLRLKWFLKDNSRGFQVLQKSHQRAQSWWTSKLKRESSAAGPQGPEPGLLDAVYREPTETVWQEAWKITAAVLLLMRDEVTAQGAKFFVVVLTNGVQVHPDPERRKNYAQWLGVQDLLYPDRRLAEFCQEEGIPILLLAPAFQEYATEHQVFLHGFGRSLGTGHWNQNGHRLAGDMLAEWLCQQIN
jgi:hypothetical protein